MSTHHPAGNARAHLIIGRVCSGKSTFAEQLRLSKGGVVLSADEAMLARYGEVPEERFSECFESVRTNLLALSVDLLRAGTDVILDWGFWTRDDRERTRAFFDGYGFGMVWYYLDLSSERQHRNIEKRNATYPNHAGTAYLVDEGLAAKCDALFEVPDRSEIDIWLTDGDIHERGTI